MTSCYDKFDWRTNKKNSLWPLSKEIKEGSPFCRFPFFIKRVFRLGKPSFNMEVKVKPVCMFKKNHAFLRLDNQEMSHLEAEEMSRLETD